MAATDKTLFDWVIRRLDKVTGPNTEGWYHARCPACGGKQPLGIRPYRTTSFLHKCFKGDWHRRALHLSFQYRFPVRRTRPGRGARGD